VDIPAEGAFLLTVSRKWIWQVHAIDEYRVQTRGGKGTIN